MNREQMVEKAAAALVADGWEGDAVEFKRQVAVSVLDAVLPQVTTVDERDSLAIGTVVRSAAGTIAARFDQELGVVFGMSLPFPWRTLQLPLIVLWAGDLS